VRFNLAGSKTLNRQEIQWTVGFTAIVNVEMQLGSVEKTVTVTEASPLVDVRHVRPRQVPSDQQLDVLPVGQQSMVRLLNMRSGFSAMPDVGGLRGTYRSNVATAPFRGRPT